MLADDEIEAQANLDHAIDLIRDANLEAAKKLFHDVLLIGNNIQVEQASYYLSLMVSLEPFSNQQNGQKQLAPNEKRQGFLMGELALMIDYVDANQLLDLPSVYHLPHSPSWFHGLANINGHIIPVFNLADFFGMTLAANQKPMLLVLNHQENATGIILDGLPRRLEFFKDKKIERNNIPKKIDRYVKDAYRIDENIWLDFNISSLCEAIEEKLSRLVY